MHWESFYVKPEDVEGDSLRFPPDEARHIARVLRKNSGDLVMAVDGKGTVYEAELTTVSPSGVAARVLQRRRRTGEPSAEIMLAQALIKGDRFDWVVEKTVELGIHGIIPVVSRYVQPAARSGKTNRRQRIALAAMKQCGRCMLPTVHEPRDFRRAVSMGAGCDLRLIAHAGPDSLSVAAAVTREYRGMPRILMLVGPEGGFSEEELAEALEQGFTPVTLGPRRLRAETAAVTMTVQVLTALGELS
ncbi:16S rRNA (uracil(1498)-N(3))-methyltransferase [bacterium]|nr:16S rRNA (uracil(1498)-N(3))-methyltransferase [bacterium]